MQGELYAAVGVPTAGMRRIWQSAAEASRSVPPEKRAKLLAAGGAAAVGLLTSATPDESAMKEMQAMGGAQPAKEVRALMALEHNDQAGARKALAEPDTMTMSMKGPSYLVFRQPLAAQAYYLLGDYERALKLLEGFDGPELNADQFDMRWGILGRVRLLRGAVLEKLGRPDDAAGAVQAGTGTVDPGRSRPAGVCAGGAAETGAAAGAELESSVSRTAAAAEDARCPDFTPGCLLTLLCCCWVGRDGRGCFGTRGKSELHRVDCQVTPGRRKATDRATESKPPGASASERRVRVKGWGKSPPRSR